MKKNKAHPPGTYTAQIDKVTLYADGKMNIKLKNIGAIKPRNLITGVDLSGQIPLLEKSGPHWLLWLSYNPERSQGTFLRLLSDGQIWRETLLHDGSVRTQIIKPSTNRELRKKAVDR
jgi:hypothetical protein